MQNVDKTLGQDAHRIWSNYRQTLASHRGISTFLFFIAQEGDPQCEAVAVPREARAFLCVQKELIDAKLREIEDWLEAAPNGVSERALQLLNDRCVEAVMLAVWKRRSAGYRVLEPDFTWLEATMH